MPYPDCWNLSLGLATKVRACKGAGQVWMLRITFHVPEGVGKCEGMSPHIPKWTPTLGVGVSMDSRIFRVITGVKTHWIEEIHISLENSWYINIWNGFAWPIWTLRTQVMAKKRSGIKLTIWFPTTKSRESSRFLCVQLACHIMLESFWRKL
jgi:hypothetical protein